MDMFPSLKTMWLAYNAFQGKGKFCSNLLTNTGKVIQDDIFANTCVDAHTHSLSNTHTHTHTHTHRVLTANAKPKCGRDSVVHIQTETVSGLQRDTQRAELLSWPAHFKRGAYTI